MRNKLPLSAHVSGSLRDPFLEAVYGGDFGTAYDLAGALWNCTDIMPGGACVELDMWGGSTYAQAARKLRAQTRNAAVHKIRF